MRLLLLVAGLAGCLAGRGDRPDRLERGLLRGAAFLRRAADPEMLDRAVATFEDLRRDAPDDPRVLEGVVRSLAVRGYAHPEAHRDDLAIAVEAGFECLRLDPRVDAVVGLAGGRWTGRASAVVPPALSACAAWTAWAWARRLEAAGELAPAIDFEPLASLAGRAVELRPDDARAHAALGLASALPPTPLEPDLGRAEAELAAAAGAGALSPRVDLALHVLERQRRLDEWWDTLRAVAGSAPADPGAAEDQRAVERARAALERGPGPGDPWAAP